MQSKEGVQASRRIKFILPKSTNDYNHEIRFITPVGQRNQGFAAPVDRPQTFIEKYQNFAKELKTFKLKKSLNDKSNNKLKIDQEASKKTEDFLQSKKLRGYELTSFNPTFGEKQIARSLIQETNTKSTFTFAKPNVQPRLFSGKLPLFSPPYRGVYEKLRPTLPSNLSPPRKIKNLDSTADLSPRTSVESEIRATSQQGKVPFHAQINRTMHSGDTKKSLFSETYEVLEDSSSTILTLPINEADDSRGDNLRCVGPLDGNVRSLGAHGENVRSRDDQTFQEKRETVLMRASSRSADDIRAELLASNDRFQYTQNDKLESKAREQGEILPQYRLGIAARKRQLEHLTTNQSRPTEAGEADTLSKAEFFQIRRNSPSHPSEGSAISGPLKSLSQLVVQKSESDGQKVRLIGKREISMGNEEFPQSPKRARNDFPSTNHLDVERDRGLQQNRSPRLIGNWPSSSSIQFINRETESSANNPRAETESKNNTCDCKECRSIRYKNGRLLSKDDPRRVDVDSLQQGRSSSEKYPVSGIEKRTPQMSNLNPHSMHRSAGRESIDRNYGYQDWPGNSRLVQDYEASNATRNTRVNEDRNRNDSYLYPKNENAARSYQRDSPRNELINGDYFNESKLSYYQGNDVAEEFHHNRKASAHFEEMQRAYSSPKSVIHHGSRDFNSFTPPRLLGTNKCPNVRTITMCAPETMFNSHDLTETKKPPKANLLTKSRVIVTYGYPKHQRNIEKGGAFCENVEYSVFNEVYQTEERRPVLVRSEADTQRSRSVGNVVERLVPKANEHDLIPTVAQTRPATADDATVSKTILLSGKDRPSLLAESMPAASPSSASLETEREIDETDSALSVSDSDDEAAAIRAERNEDAIAQPWAKKKTQGPRLYRFLLELLEQPELYNCIKWVNKEERMFKFTDSNYVAKLWGKRKNRPNMKYENFARSLRCYKNRGILTKPRQKLVYQFAEGW